MWPFYISPASASRVSPQSSCQFWPSHSWPSPTYASASKRRGLPEKGTSALLLFPLLHSFCASVHVVRSVLQMVSMLCSISSSSVLEPKLEHHSLPSSLLRQHFHLAAFITATVAYGHHCHHDFVPKFPQGEKFSIWWHLSALTPGLQWPIIGFRVWGFHAKGPQGWAALCISRLPCTTLTIIAIVNTMSCPVYLCLQGISNKNKGRKGQ